MQQLCFSARESRAIRLSAKLAMHLEKCDASAAAAPSFKAFCLLQLAGLKHSFSKTKADSAAWEQASGSIQHKAPGASPLRLAGHFQAVDGQLFAGAFPKGKGQKPRKLWFLSSNNYLAVRHPLCSLDGRNYHSSKSRASLAGLCAWCRGLLRAP